ncbi:MAG: 4-hydroxy-tetrahydrodipicolinate synthase, partial [Verrucomicrobium sp.]
QLTVEYTAGRGIVMAGTGSNSTREAIEMTQEAETAGANAALLVAPYYNKPTQEGLFRHFKAIADNTKLPIMLYSIPGRCGVEIGLETVVRLAEACPNIRAIKEAGGAPDRVSQMKMLLPAEFEILSGDDSLTLPFMSVGGVGVVSVAGNLIPGEMNQMVQAALAGRWVEAQAIHARFNPLFSAFLKLSTNPIPIKTALALKGICDAELRLPMCELGEAQVKELRQTMINVGILAE